jgi:hypothetical protein
MLMPILFRSSGTHPRAPSRDEIPMDYMILVVQPRGGYTGNPVRPFRNDCRLIESRTTVNANEPRSRHFTPGSAFQI